jgi:antirestriction protein ArdC
MKNNVHEAIQKKIINDIKIVIDGKKKLLPWQKRWVDGEPPQNILTKTIYRGSNVFLLNNIAECNNYKTNFWVSSSYKKHGAWIEKDEWKNNSWITHFEWKIIEDEDSGNIKRFPRVKSWPVWNIDQLKDFGDIKIPESKGIDFIPHEKSMEVCTDFIYSERSRTKREILRHIQSRNGRAYYNPSKHIINTPPMGDFFKAADYPMTIFHELVHSTGHVDILNRDLMCNIKGDKEYSFEELVAEMGSMYLANQYGLEIDFDNSLEYLRGWLSAIEMNPKWLIKAGGKAQSAIDLIIGE